MPALSIWRDVAVVLLTLEAIVLALLPGILLYWSWPAVRQLHRRLPTWLFRTRLVIWRIQRLTQRAMCIVAMPLVWLRSAAEGVHQTLKHLGRRRLAMEDDDVRRTAVLGAFLGALLGAIFAVLYRRWAYQRRLRGGKPIRARQIVRFSLALVPVVRQFLKLIS